MKNVSLDSLKPLLAQGRKLTRYSGILFILLLALCYGFIVMRINTLSNIEVDQSAVDEKIEALPTPRIDAEAAKQLQTLKDNSVNVQTLFEEGRTNPFQE